MGLLLLIGGGIIGVLAGRILLGRWFNYLSIYSAVWAISLVLYAFQLIQYNPIIPQAWFFIALAWFVLYLGSVTVIFARVVTHHVSKDAKHIPKDSFSINDKSLARAILVLCIIASVSIVLQWVEVIRFFGGLKVAIENANQLYNLRVGGELWEGIPYLGAFALGACSLAGIYTAIRGRLTFVGILPLALVLLQGISAMGRTGIVIAGVLFLTSFLYTPHSKLSKGKTLIGLILVTAVLIEGFTFISSTRHLRVQFPYEAPVMETLRSDVSFLPSLYFYLSGPPVAFSEYLRSGGEKVFPGTYTFRPLFNILAKVGFINPLPRYTAPYFTPEPMNAATYLRDVHADFGPFGIAMFPYVLGLLLTILHFQIKQCPTVTRNVLLAHLFVIVFLSWDISPMYLGFYWVSILVDLLAISIMRLAHDVVVKRKTQAFGGVAPRP